MSSSVDVIKQPLSQQQAQHQMTCPSASVSSVGTSASSVTRKASSSNNPARQLRRKPKHSVHWFRRGLRLSDNPALLRAVKRSETWRCVFILDPWFAGSSSQGINKWRFLLDCLENLDESLRKLNSRLFVVRGQPADVLPQLFREWGTNYFSFEEDPEPYGQIRDKNIMAMCKELGVNVVTEASHTLYNPEKIIELNDGKPPLTYRHFIKIISQMKPPPIPVPTLSSRMLGNSTTPIETDHDEKFGVPTLAELGFDPSAFRPAVWKGGETEALTRLESHLQRKVWVASFGRPKMTPQSLLASPNGLSPYLRFGSLSTRLFYHALGDLYRKIKKKEPPLSLFGQILWREFFFTAAAKNPNFDKMYGNPICVQIPWDKNPEALAKWANGRTGFPWIDAIMTQLREEGWIHHLARHAVACFLTRGDLWLSWEEGMKVFDELLLDAEWSVNAGTWMWLSCSSFFQQFFHLYCPVKFGRKADPDGGYIRRYLPVLKNFPTKYIHEPWTAPDQVQKAAKCIIGKDFPVPMVDHEAVSKINQDRMRQIYQQLAAFKNVTPGSGDIVSPHSNEVQEPVRQQSTNSMSRVASTSSEHQFLSPPVRTSVAHDRNVSQNNPVSRQLMQQQQGHSGQVQLSQEQVGALSAEDILDDVDSIVPSIGSYEPQVIRDTLQREADLQRAEREQKQRKLQRYDVNLDIRNNTSSNHAK